MARVTERIRLGPAALNPFTLHPYEIAGQIAMLDSVSGGRAYLGLAKGAWLDRLGLEEARPLAALQEAVAIVRALLAGDTAGVAGERFRLEPGTALAYPRARSEVPLLIGTWGRETARWAGTVADELKIGGSGEPRASPGRPGLDREHGVQPRRRLRDASSTRTARGLASARAERGSAVSRRRRATRSDARARRRAGRRSSASASRARRRRWPSACRRAVGGRCRPRRARDAAGPNAADRRRARSATASSHCCADVSSLRWRG